MSAPEESTIGTLRQYAEYLRRSYMAENPGLRRAMYDDAYPVESRLGEWCRAIGKAAQAGEIIRVGTLDDLWRRNPLFVRHLLHDYPSAIPAGWLNPDTRKWNREREAEMRQARSAGQAAALRAWATRQLPPAKARRLVPGASADAESETIG